MKKIVTLLGLVFNLTLVSAQQTYTEYFDSKFANISKTDATTGILYDCIVPFSGLDQFNPDEVTVDTSNAKHFIQAYRELHRIAFFPVIQFSKDVESLENEI